MTVSDPAIPTSTRAAGLTLTARGAGAWLLSLTARHRWGAGTIEVLEAEILNPVPHHSQGPPSSPQVQSEPQTALLRRRRGRMRKAELTIDQDSLNRSLADAIKNGGAASPSPHPTFDWLYVQLDGKGDNRLLVLFLLTDAGTRAPGRLVEPVFGAAQIACRTGGSGFHDLVLSVTDVYVFGPVTLAAPLVGHAVLQRLAQALTTQGGMDLPEPGLGNGPSPPGLHVATTPSLSELRLELLSDAVLHTLPLSGYRAADASSAPLIQATIEPRLMRLVYATDGTRGYSSYHDFDDRSRSSPAIDTEAIAMGAGLPECLRLADFFLSTGEMGAALVTYELAQKTESMAAAARMRRVGVLAMAAPESARHRACLDKLLTEDPDHPSSLLTQASLLLTGQGASNQRAAARQWHLLAARPDLSVLVRAMAAYAAARLLRDLDISATRAALRKAEGLLAAVALDETARALFAELAGGLRLDHGSGDPHPTRRSIPALNIEALRQQAATLEPTERRALFERALDEHGSDPRLLLLHLECELDAPDAALAQLEKTLALLATPQHPVTAEAEGQVWVEVLLLAGKTAAGRGEIDRSRAFYTHASQTPAALHERAKLDWPELLSADAGSPADLLPVLRALREQQQARPDELRGLARLLTLRGLHSESLTVQKEAGGNPDELLAGLEAAGRFEDLLAAIPVHATEHPGSAVMLYQQGATIAEQQMQDAAQAAEFWRQAAEASGRQESQSEGTALMWFHSGRLYQAAGDAEKAYTALGQAIARGGTAIPSAHVMLAELAYTLGDREAATLYFREALSGNRLTPQERLPLCFRLAELAAEQRDHQTAEQALTAAIEAGGGPDAFSHLVQIYQQLGDTEQQAHALVSWANLLPQEGHASNAERIRLLHEAERLAPPALLARIDDELLRADGDDEAVRERVLERHRAQGDAAGFLRVLVRDVTRSPMPRCLEQAHRLIEIATDCGDQDAALTGWLTLLEREQELLEKNEAPPSAGPDVERALAFWRVMTRSLHLLRQGQQALVALRALIVRVYNLPDLLLRLERQLALLSHKERLPAAGIATALQAATIAELCGDYQAAVRHQLRLCTVPGAQNDAMERLRSLVRSLAELSQLGQAMTWIEQLLVAQGGERGDGTGWALRAVLAEAMLALGRSVDAQGQLSAVLLTRPSCGAAHAMLGMLLATSGDAETSQRGLQHLLQAAYLINTSPAEAGECALMAADLLAAGGFTEPVELSLLFGHELQGSGSATGYTERSNTRSFVAVPADFLETSDEVKDERADQEPLLDGVVPSVIGPADLLQHAAELLPLDPRPLEGLLGLYWSWGQDEAALSYCDALLALPVTQAVPTECERVRIEKCHVLIRLGRVAAAETLLREILAHNPRAEAAMQTLRQLLLSMGELASARELAVQQVALAEETAHTAEGKERLAHLLCELAELLHRLGAGDQAAAAWKRAGQLGLATGWQRLATALTLQSDWLEAADAAGRAASLLPQSERQGVLLRAVDWALRADDELRAREYLHEIVGLGGEAALVAEERLHTLDGGSEPERRFRSLERRLQRTARGAERTEILRRMVGLCHERGERAQLVAYAAELLEDVPTDAQGLCALAEDAMERGQPEVALEHVRRIEGGTVPLYYPGAANILAWLGDAHERRGEWPEAQRAYEQLLTLAERNSDAGLIDTAMTGLVQCATAEGDHAQALRVLRRQLSGHSFRDATSGVALRMRMVETLLQLENWSEARAQLEQIVQLSAQHRTAWVKLVDLYRRLKEPERALAAATSLLDLAMTPGERAEWLFVKGDITASDLQNESGARQWYVQSVAQWPGHVKAQRRLITLAARAGDGEAVQAAAAAIAKAGGLLGEVQTLTTLGLALVAETPLSQLTQNARTASREQLAAGLAGLCVDAWTSPETLARPVQVALDASGGDAEALSLALGDVVADSLRQKGKLPMGGLSALTHLTERFSLPTQGFYRATLRFLQPKRAKRDEEGAGCSWPISQALLSAEQTTAAAFPSALRPWAAALSVLGRSIEGLTFPALPLAQNWREKLEDLAQSQGVPRMAVSLVETLSKQQSPAVVDSTRPPRLRMLSWLTREPAAARFATLRGLLVARMGVSLTEHIGLTKAAGLLRAVAALWLDGTAGAPTMEALSPTDKEAVSWLRALALHPAHEASLAYLAQSERAAFVSCCQALSENPRALDELWPALANALRSDANVQALSQLGDVEAALTALTDVHAERKARLSLIGEEPLSSLWLRAQRLYEHELRTQARIA